MIDPPTLVWEAKNWIWVAAGSALILLTLLILGYVRVGATKPVRFVAGTLKALAILILLLCLLEPMFSGERARPGANQFVVLADNSQSMTLKDSGSKTRGDELKALAGRPSAWLAQLGRDFELRDFAFDSQLRAVDGFDDLAFDGHSSDLSAALDRLLRRFQGRPLAGIILLTDGSATDAEAIDRVLANTQSKPGEPGAIPPIYPVLMGRPVPPADISLERIDVTQTNFEDAPVTLSAHMTTSGERGQTLVTQLLDPAGKVVDTQKVKVEQDGQPLVARFQLKPDQPGVSFYKVRVAAESQVAQFDHPEQSTEATLANNTRLAVVDRGHGPFRVLYVSGRPNWEFKFLRRAIQSDDQVHLVGLIRIAKREPKFNFLSRTGETSNPLYRGFGNQTPDQVEQFDHPVLVRLGTEDEAELHGDFPKTPEELFKYHAIILDDVESEFFSTDQMLLVKDFVRQRGGGLLMLGGEESFKTGKYDRTAIGDMLPVYVDQPNDPPPNPSTPPTSALPLAALSSAPDPHYRMELSREGWLEPWLRLRPDEDSERARLNSMPGFQVLNPIRGIKPGATTLARAIGDDGISVPALVEQRFGEGRVSALLLGDLWRWELSRPANTEPELEKAWRQTVRWLVSDVPQRINVTIDPQRQPDDAEGTLRLVVQVRDPAFAPLDNAIVKVKITAPDATSVEMRAEASPRQPGRYEALYIPRQPGAYLANIAASAPDGADIGTTQAGWASDPAAEEFRALQPNAALLEHIARITGGQVVAAADLPAFAAELPTKKAPITEPYVEPLWHRSWVFLIAIACLAAEWGLRRWKGLP